jgi:hypothetical protein
MRLLGLKALLLFLLHLPAAGRAPFSITTKLKYLPPEDREKARQPPLLEAPGFKPISLPVGKAQRATRSRWMFT